MSSTGLLWMLHIQVKMVTSLASDFDYDVIILDLMLPNMQGEELCRKLRKEKNETFIIMLTAKKQLGNIIDGLNIGADDYITKPFEFTELLARIRALIQTVFQK